MLLSVILYGSRARGDFRSSSDTDLLGIIEAGRIRTEVANGGTSLYHYPLPALRLKAEEGDLFMLHLALEGRVLHDTCNAFGDLKKAFVQKDSYESEVIDASIILLFFIARQKLLIKKGARKRFVWAMRTILIARSVELSRPVFSSSGLGTFSGLPDVKQAIDNRNRPDVEALLKAGRRILARFGNHTNVQWPSEKSLQRQLMRARGGIVADTLRFVQPLIRKNATADVVGAASNNDGLLYFE